MKHSIFLSILFLFLLTLPSSLFAQSKVKMFDGCGSLAQYKSQPWYKALPETFRNGESLSSVEDACYSKSKQLFIMLIPGDEYCEGPTIYRFHTGKLILTRAFIVPHGHICLSTPREWGKRVGNVIKLVGQGGDAGYQTDMYFDYDFRQNKVDLRKKHTFRPDGLEIEERLEIFKKKSYKGWKTIPLREGATIKIPAGCSTGDPRYPYFNCPTGTQSTAFTITGTFEGRVTIARSDKDFPYWDQMLESIKVTAPLDSQLEITIIE